MIQHTYTPTPAEETIHGLVRAIFDLDLSENMGLERAAELAKEIQQVAEQQASKPYIHPIFAGILSNYSRLGA